jgi:hypothetical protein
MSCMNTVETMQSHDCMAIGLSITRPEAAIADPSRVVVNDIFPTYVSTESFLESARYKLVDNQYQKAQAENVHGGFSKDPKGKGAQVVMGAGRENITGVLPLALFDEHWAIARRKMQPILGFMCTLDVLGYSSEQYFTIPFTVLATALHKVAQDPSEINKRMLYQIQDTCIRIVTHSKTFRQELITNLINFQTLSAEASFRTTDKIKGINCFLTQFYTLLSINNFESLIEDADQKAFFSDQAKLLELKRTVVRFAVEEQLRRVQQKPEKVYDNILQLLFPSNKTAFVDPVWERRKKEIAQLFKQDNKAQGADAFEKYKAYANVLREQYGYGKETVPKDDGQIDSNAQNEDQNKDAVDFAQEIAKLVANFEFKNANSESAVTQMNKAFVLHHQQLIHLCSLILKETLLGPVNDLFDLPYISESKSKFDILLATLIQNAYHAKNSDRVSAVESKTYVELLDGKAAYNYLVDALASKLKQHLLSLESELVKQHQSDATDILSEQILTAPDQFHAAAMMK